MAKNLKLKIKNAQLAEALNLNKEKIKATKEASATKETKPKKLVSAKEEVASPKVAKAPAAKATSKVPASSLKKEQETSPQVLDETAPKKRTIKATNVPSAFQETKTGKTSAEDVITTPAKEPPQPEETFLSLKETSPSQDEAEDHPSADLKFDLKKELKPEVPSAAHHEGYKVEKTDTVDTSQRRQDSHHTSPRQEYSKPSYPKTERPYEPRSDYTSRPPRSGGNRSDYQNRPPHRDQREKQEGTYRSEGQRPPYRQHTERQEGYRGDNQNRPYRPPSDRTSSEGYRHDTQRPYRPSGERRPFGEKQEGPRGDGQNRPYRPPSDRSPSDSYRGGDTQNRPFSRKPAFSTPLAEEFSKEGKSPSRRETKGSKSFNNLDDTLTTKKAKEVKPAAKKVEHKSFDSRDRQGLRADGEEGSWRKKRLKFKSEEKQEQIIRPKNLKVKLPIAIKDLAAAMKLKASELIAKLLMQGVVLTLNDYLDDETMVQLLGADFECDIQIDTTEEDRLKITGKKIQEEIKEASPEKLTLRPPVVAFMGHVDHGKTSLIDSLRKSNIAAGEAGSITQHIGAFQVHTPHGAITVLDTPGHEAFTEMRERGANVTDIVILVVAGDEGMMQQTIEAMNQAKNAKVAIVVAVNKCDKPGYNAENVYRQLAEHELLPEEWGGSTITVKCSALTGEGIPQLLEMLLLQAEVLELKADKTSRARGTVIESQLHKGMGCVATVLVQNGTLKYGDALVFDDVYGRVKTMQDEHGKLLKEAGPSCPVKITGLSGLPEAGCEFIVVDNEKEARKICEERTAGSRHERLHRRSQVELEGLIKRKQELSEKKILNLIVRADVQGSLEALKNSLMKLPTNKVEIRIVSEGVGQISESDIQLAATSNASIIGFHTSIESHAEKDIARLQVTIKTHDIIYHLIDDVKKLMTAKLDKIKQENEIGHAVVKAIFKASQLGNIAGCQVADGIIKRSSHAKLDRKGEIIWEGQIASLKRMKEDVKEVSKGLECGIVLANYQDIEEGDLIRAFEITYLAQEL